MRHALLATCLLAAVAQPLAAAQPKFEVTEAYINENLAKIPAADPAVTAAPAVRAELQGKHPRLLFTTAEAAALKQVALADPLLKPVYESIAANAKRFSLGKDDPPAIVLTDTPAIAGSAQQHPAAAVAYVIDRDPAVLKAITEALTVMLDQPHWAATKELDSSMGAGCNMLMTGLLYDAVRDDLEPEFRAKLAAKLLVHVRRLHWLGFKQLCTGSIKYWQQDPQPNHRWYRIAGVASCLLAVADEPGLDTAYQLAELKKEMDFLMKWLPVDGDCHEGAGYQTFGFAYLTLAASMCDRVFGTTYLKTPGFANAWRQQIHYGAPGRMGNMSFGDDMNGEGLFNQNNTAFFIGPRLSRDPLAQAALLRRLDKEGQPYLAKYKPEEKRPFVPPWGMLVFYDPTVVPGDYRELPKAHLFADLGAASMRDSWEDDGVAFAFKCGPIGGYKLNEYAWEHKNEKGEPHYVNVAHDDSDANTFTLAMAGELIFHPGLYSWSKVTRKQNGVTVDGKGQLCEGTDYTQPVPGATDMRDLSYLTGWKQGEAGRIIVEGEASGTYRGVNYRELVARQKGTPAAEGVAEVAGIPGLPDAVLTRFRRSAVWLPGEYILLLDDIAAAGERAITWRGTVEKAHFDKPEEGRCFIATKGGKRIDFQMLADRPFSGAIDFMHLDGRFGNNLQHQFQFTAQGEAVKFACLIDAWGKKPTLTLAKDGDTVTLRVAGGGFNDTWTWSSATDATTPSAITGTRAGAPLIALTSSDKAPHGD